MMANGRSWYTLTRGGTAFKSLSRGAMLFLTEDIRILLKSVDGKRQPGHAPSDVVLQQVVLVRLEQAPFHAFSWQKEQLPVGQFNQLRSRRLVLLEEEHQEGERLDRQVHRGDTFLDSP